jgi:hypothetical protein
MPSPSRKGPDVEQTLADLHLAADDPIERAAVQQFGGALRNHPRRVPLLRLLAGAAHLGHPDPDPALQVLDRVAADAELQEVQFHAAD